MIRFILAILALVICGMVGPAEAAARHRHHHHHHRTHFAVRHHAPAPTPVRTDIHEQHHAEQGVPHMAVTPSASGQFHAMAAEFVAMGYSVGRPGCLSLGHMAHSKHHWGGACDLFNQVARNRTALRQPPPAVQIEVATRHGLTSGCIWRNPDCGHFEVPTPSHAVFYSPRQRHRVRVRLAWGLALFSMPIINHAVSDFMSDNVPGPCRGPIT